MALFGAPIAHEDHAARACYAALHLRDRLSEYSSDVRRDHGLGISVRMGMNSGEVVVGSVGSALDLNYTAVGNTVGLAARMESVAEPGKPCLTAATAALVRGYFELEDLGSLHVKGVADPVPAHALLGIGDARSRLDLAGGLGLSRFVGRDEEMAALEAALARAERDGQVVGIVAEPGLGKSRLCREFVERCKRQGLEVTEGRGVAHGRRIPLLPVIEMMRAYFNVSEADDGREARHKIAGRLLLLDEGFREALPIVFDFLGVPDPDRPPPQISPEARQRALFSVVRHIVEARSRERPGLLVVEDLHWLDPGSDAFLENLVESLPGSRTLLVVNFRPEYRAGWMQKSYYQQLPLLPLSGEALEALVRDLLGDDPSLDGLSDLIAERTGGNPFFVEEVVQGLIESGTLVGERGSYRLTRSIESIDIPPTVQAVLAARIDRLSEREKSVLQSAAVIGREFSEPVLRMVTGLPEHELSAALSELRTAELVYEKTLYPEAEYAFKHPLTEEVAYRSQLGDRRKRLHGQVADALEEVYADRLDELAGLVANHREQAGDVLAAARWNARAAAWAGQHHPADAVRHWRHVRSLVGEAEPSPEAAALGATACAWILQLGWRLGGSKEEVEEVHAHGTSLAESIGASSMSAAIHSSAGTARGMAGGVEQALRHFREALSLAQGTEELEFQIATGAAYWRSVTGELQEALDEIDPVIERAGDRFELGRELVGFSMPIWCLFFRGALLADLGRLPESRASLERAIELASEHDDPESLGWSCSTLASVSYLDGEVTGEELEHGRRGLEIAERLGSSFSRLAARIWFGVARLAREEWVDALRIVEEALDEMRSTRTGLQYESFALSLKAEALIGSGDVRAAVEAATEGLAAAQRSGVRAMEARCRGQLGRALIADGNPGEEAERQLEAALDGCGRFAPGGLPTVLEALADLAAARGDTEEEQRHLDRARKICVKQGAHGRERRLSDRLAALAATA
jgi:adenylate cyclase